MPGAWLHLTARFLDVASAPPLEPVEIDQATRWLRPGEDGLFFAQADADQRHGLEAAREAASQAPDRPDLVRAALLHDVGKRHARLGAIGRVVASLLIKLGWLVRGRVRMYRDHGPLAATELAELGAEPAVVEFARHHHTGRPEGFPMRDWELLVAADRARVRRGERGTRYSGGIGRRRRR